MILRNQIMNCKEREREREIRKEEKTRRLIGLGKMWGEIPVERIGVRNGAANRGVGGD